LGGAAVTADNSENQVREDAVVSEPVVQVWGARTRGAKGIFGVHTWIAVRPRNETEYTVYEVVGWRLRWTDTAVVVRNRAPNHWFGAEGELYAEKRGAGVEALIQRIDKLAREYPYANTYTLWPGPNSNTFVAWIASNFPLRAGTQKLWLTSPWGAVTSTWTTRPCGTRIRSIATAPFG